MVGSVGMVTADEGEEELHGLRCGFCWRCNASCRCLPVLEPAEEYLPGSELKTRKALRNRVSN